MRSIWLALTAVFVRSDDIWSGRHCAIKLPSSLPPAPLPAWRQHLSAVAMATDDVTRSSSSSRPPHGIRRLLTSADDVTDTMMMTMRMMKEDGGRGEVGRLIERLKPASRARGRRERIDWHGNWTDIERGCDGMTPHHSVRTYRISPGAMKT